MMAGEPAVVARDLRKSYDGRVALDGISFTVQPGTCFGFLGPNGAGKTTTMKMIYGLATVGEGDKKISLLDAVVAAYNVGYGAVDTAEGLVIPNQRYVDNVEALMSTCPCTQY